MEQQDKNAPFRQIGKTGKRTTAKRLVFLSKITILLFAITAATVSSYFKEDTVAASKLKEHNNYTIEFKPSSIFFKKVNSQGNPQWEEFEWEDELEFKLLQFNEDSGDYNFLLALNENIRNAMTYWIDGKVVNADAVDISIFCHSDRYLSFLNTFTFEGNHYGYIYDYITIDMQTGERVMLDDLVEINEDFIKHIQYDDIAKRSWYVKEINRNNSFASLREDFKSIDPSELLDMLNGCSLTNEQIADADYWPLTESIGSLMFRNSFYLKDGALVLMLNDNSGKNIEFSVDDISDFLKVEKW